MGPVIVLVGYAVILVLAPVLGWSLDQVWKLKAPDYPSLQVSPSQRHVISGVVVVVIYSLGWLVALSVHALFGW